MNAANGATKTFGRCASMPGFRDRTRAVRSRVDRAGDPQDDAGLVRVLPLVSYRARAKDPTRAAQAARMHP